jgi:hypothetical protein
MQVDVRFETNQCGVSVEARRPGGEWMPVEVLPLLRTPASPSVRAYRECLDVEGIKASYLATLAGRGIVATVHP